jgi:AraC family transcriptional regulator of adaptative response/methylated-DNA-[protein]-cysteine methyltransferase
MVAAYLDGDRSYDGVFFTAVRTTGIFCRPGCPARKPKPENVEFFASTREALLAGYRPCLRCRPMEAQGTPPAWLAPLLGEIEADPARRWRDRDLRALRLEPGRVRRWFLAHHGMTFQAYSRARRLASALGRIKDGADVTEAAFAIGYDSLSGFHEAFRHLLGESPTRAKGAPVVTLARVPTELGPMVVAADDRALLLLEFADRRMLETQLKVLRRRLGCAFAPGTNPIIERATREMQEYLAGTRRRFETTWATPGTPFQRAVWERLAEIPFGATLTYAALARAVGRPAAVRAVARAVGDNRIAVMVPCHRVVGSDGDLTGYGGGLWRKKRLLEIEGVLLPIADAEPARREAEDAYALRSRSR